jgi:hypothetical protein
MGIKFKGTQALLALYQRYQKLFIRMQTFMQGGIWMTIILKVGSL